MTARTTALVLSGGGLFGAYQAGCWSLLAEILPRPEIVIGASVGCLNGWAIAGGAPPDQLIRRWLDLSEPTQRFRFPRRLAQGFLDPAPLERWIADLWQTYRPQTRYGVVATRLRGLEPRLFEWPDVSPRHLAASCAVFGFLDQQRLEGSLYTDGGVMGALPMWAAAAAGADRAIGINLLPLAPASFRWIGSGLRRIKGRRSGAPGIPQVVIAPQPPLGGALDMAVHRQHRIEAWIERGRADTRAALPAIRALLEAQ